MSNFEMFLIAHLIGDFLLQNNWMALNKTTRVVPLLVHLSLYTLCVTVFFPCLTWQRLLVVLLFHGIIDRFSLADKWLRLIRGRSFKSIDKVQSWKGREVFVTTLNGSGLGSKEAPVYREGAVYISFTAVVYVVVDFLLHFLTTYPILVLRGL